MPRFRQKLALAFGLILVLATLCTDLFVTRIIGEHLRQELIANVSAQAQLIAALVPPSAPGKPATTKLQPLVRKLAQATRCRVTLIDRSGAVLADSDVETPRLASLENHAGRPEVREALEGRSSYSMRWSSTLGEDLLYAAAPIAAGAGVARVAMPLTEVRKRVNETRQAIAYVSLGMLFLAVVAVFWLSRSVTRPVDEMSRVANKLTEADYSVRVRNLGNDELGQLGRTLNLLAGKIQATVTELSREKSQLSTILSHIVEAVIAISADGRVMAVNPSFSALFGLDAEAAAGKPSIEAVRHAPLNALLTAVLRERRAHVEEVSVFTPEERLFEAQAVPLSEEGRPAGALLVLHDITRLRRLEQVRREFVANVSHELRTPLASIKGFAETLRDGAVDDTAHRMEFIEAIEKDAERLTALVDDLLDLSAIESGQRRLALEPVSIIEEARKAAAGLQPLAKRSGVTIKIEDASDLPPVQSDRAQLGQVLRNLLDNAVKFNRTGGTVTVTATVSGAQMVLSVSDTGTGIPPEDLPRLFERFYRVDKARSREIGGTGLGLSIVKHIAESHGGSVEVLSRLGEGSIFRVRLPL
jgi:two-component system phosphate regulon sensor histidine kinase PhoR